MTTGTISKWNLDAGDSFAAGDVLCEIGTDKAMVDFEAQDDGFLAKILHPAGGEELDVGVPICVVVEEEEDMGRFEDFVVERVGGGAEEAMEEVAASTTPVAVAQAGVDMSKPIRDVEDAFVLTPAARHLSQSKNIDATYLQGTGRGGRVTKGDVLAALEKEVPLPPWKIEASAETPTAPIEDVLAATPPTAAVTPPPTPPTPTPSPINPTEVIIPSITTSGTYTDIPNTMMRKIIAKRLTDSKSTVPHFYASIEIELDEILALRKRLLSQHDVKVSVNDIILKASALALRDVPEVNSSLTTHNNTSRVSVSPTIDISVAVATPTGLITPIVPNTDTLGLTEISAIIKDLAIRAREGKLQPEEYQGGSFCISNLGMFGINEFSAVINPPQAAILAVGGGVKRVLVGSPWVDGGGEQEGPGVRSVMTARLSADRRVVDEPTVALWLAALRYYMNKPELLLL